MIEKKLLEPIVGTALLYPCCGNDLETPIRLFGSSVSDFFFVDIRRPKLPRNLRTFAVQVGPPVSTEVGTFLNTERDNRFQIHRLTGRGEDSFSGLPKIGVFFHRGDTLADGEGSSGVPWLGREWLTRILGVLVPGGFLVTDGSNCPQDGPPELKEFYWNSKMGEAAASKAKPFNFLERNFTCVGYAGDRYGPTLIWRIT